MNNYSADSATVSMGISYKFGVEKDIVPETSMTFLMLRCHECGARWNRREAALVPLAFDFMVNPAMLDGWSVWQFSLDSEQWREVAFASCPDCTRGDRVGIKVLYYGPAFSHDGNRVGDSIPDPMRAEQ